MIESNLKAVVERQKAYGVYRPEEFIQNPYNTNYWAGHLIEEICEYLEADLDEELSEIADVIIFAQNLTAYLYPEYTLTLDLEKYAVEKNLEPLADVLLAIRQRLPNRKSWKTYNPIEFTRWLEAIELLLKFVCQFYTAEQIEAEYFKKESGNKTRTDWERPLTTN
jgi:predicted house-cleaning noncanonical NTP pyrophosphatase (MazG superfamily)